MKKVYIIDSNYPSDHFFDRADGAIAQNILKALGIRANLRLALDRDHFKKAVARATRAECDVLHISAHGNEDGIAICADIPGSGLPQGFEWKEFVGLFQGEHSAPEALLMAVCNGASSGLAHEFEKVEKRPNIIVGSTAELCPADYVAAWALLYRKFKRSGINRETAMEAIKDVCAVVDASFLYWRWNEEGGHYRRFPGAGKSYAVMERNSKGRGS